MQKAQSCTRAHTWKHEGAGSGQSWGCSCNGCRQERLDTQSIWRRHADVENADTLEAFSASVQLRIGKVVDDGHGCEWSDFCYELCIATFPMNYA
eukprot:6203778-Pleurochrysis_carterae.AAC.2